VYDYADLDIPMLARMFDRRCRAYEAVGYAIVLPAGAISGWPADVPLPVDPAWKRDYAASVRRLARDGVESESDTTSPGMQGPSLKNWGSRLRTDKASCDSLAMIGVLVRASSVIDGNRSRNDRSMPGLPGAVCS
jgi:hypothetical protein